MKNLCAAMVLVSSVMAMGQEIGTEITPVTPTSGASRPVNQPNDNPYAPAATTTPDAQKPVNALVSLASAGKGAFGIRASFAAGGLPTLSTAANTTTSVGTIGLSYFATDGLTLLFDLGAGLGIVRGNALFGFSAAIGIDYHFRTPADALRPIFNLQVGLGSAIAQDLGVGLGLFAQVGGGAEYFFNPSFSVIGRLGLGFSVAFNSGAVLLSSVTPGVGAAWYF